MTAGFPLHVVDAALVLPRQYPPTDAGVAAALAALGDTAVEVAETLRRGGFRGARGCEGRCPVGNYLASHLPADVTVCVDCYDVVVLTARGGKAAVIDLPDPVCEFVAEFDRGAAYTDLDESQPDPAVAS